MHILAASLLLDVHSHPQGDFHLGIAILSGLLALIVGLNLLEDDSEHTFSTSSTSDKVAKAFAGVVVLGLTAVFIWAVWPSAHPKPPPLEEPSRSLLPTCLDTTAASKTTSETGRLSASSWATGLLDGSERTCDGKHRYGIYLRLNGFDTPSNAALFLDSWRGEIRGEAASQSPSDTDKYSSLAVQPFADASDYFVKEFKPIRSKADQVFFYTETRYSPAIPHVHGEQKFVLHTLLFRVGRFVAEFVSENTDRTSVQSQYTNFEVIVIDARSPPILERLMDETLDRMTAPR